MVVVCMEYRFSKWSVWGLVCFSSRRRNTRSYSLTGGQTCALPIFNTSKKKQDIENIKAAEKVLYASDMLDRDKGLAIVQQYVDFAKEYPADTLSATYLFKAAEIAMNLNVGSQSVLYFDKILTNYPDYSKVPESMFLKAFVLENQIKKYEQAGEQIGRAHV